MGDERIVSVSGIKLQSGIGERTTTPPDRKLLAVANLFKVLGDATRIDIMYSLMENTELCVQELAESTQMNASAVSHHLRILRQEKIVRQRRNGKQIFYSMSDSHVLQILQKAIILKIK